MSVDASTSANATLVRAKMAFRIEFTLIPTMMVGHADGQDEFREEVGSLNGGTASAIHGVPEAKGTRHQ